jgi:hypothetical protein
MASGHLRMVYMASAESWNCHKVHFLGFGKRIKVGSANEIELAEF